MTRKEVYDMVQQIGLPAAYHHFTKATAKEPPFICFYYPGSDDYHADNLNYVRIDQLIVELYTDSKSFDDEAAVENVLNAYGMTFAKDEAYISDEKMYMTTYTMEVIINV